MLVSHHMLLLTDFGPYVILMKVCVLLQPQPSYGDRLLFRDFGIYRIL